MIKVLKFLGIPFILLYSLSWGKAVIWIIVALISILLLIHFIDIKPTKSAKNNSSENTTPENVVVTPNTNIIFDGYTPHTEYINYKFEIYSDRPIYLKFQGVSNPLLYDGTHGFAIPANATAGDVFITSADETEAKVTIKKL